MLSPGDLLIGQYRIESVIGHGGFGQVYLAYDEAMDRYVAIKELLGRTAESSPEQWDEYRRRFAKEAQAISHIAHPNIVSAYGLEQDAQGSLYLVSEYVEGGSLRELLEGGPLDTEHAVSIGIDIAQAIEEIYRHDIVHRDIKPSNILLKQDGHAKLTDFGVAQMGRETLRTQEASEHPGTPAYKSPEQATTTGYLDQRSDLYALGLVLYEMLTGTLYVRNRVPPHRLNPRVPLALSRVVLKTLEEDPARRYQTAAALRRDLERVRDQSTLGQAIILLQGIPTRQLLAVGATALALFTASGLYRIGSALQNLPFEGLAAAPTASPTFAAGLALLPPPDGMRQALLMVSGENSPAGGNSESGASLLGAASQGPGEGLPSAISVGERQTWEFGQEGQAHSVVFRVKAGNTYLVSTSNLAIGVDTLLEVIADDRVLINDDVAPGTLASQVSFTALEDGTAQVTVHNQDRYGPGRVYDLSVILVEATALAPQAHAESAPEVTTALQPSPSVSRSLYETPTPRPTFTLRPTWTPAARTPTSSASRTPSPTWTHRPTWTPIPTQSTLIMTPTAIPTATPTPLEPTAMPTTPTPLEPTATHTPTAVPTATHTPTATPVPMGSPDPPLPGI